MERFNKIESWVVALVSILSLCGLLAVWDCSQSIADNRPITPFTTWVIGFVVVEHIAILVGAFLLHNHAPELEALRQASAENMGLRTRVMFLTQDNERMLQTIRGMEGRVAPATTFRQHTKRQDSHRRSQPARTGGT